MKIFTLSLAVALCCGISAEAAQTRKAAVRPDIKTLLSQVATPVRAVASLSDEEPEIIYEAPDGEETLMSRGCEGFELEAYESVHAPVLGSIATFVTTDGGDVYIGNPISGYPVETYLKAIQMGDTLSIQGAQPIYEEYDWETEESYLVYVVPMEIIVDENHQGTCVPASDMRYDLILNESGEYVSTDHNKMLGVCLKSDALSTGYEYAWSGYGDRDLKFAEVTSTTVDIPEGAEIQRWVWEDQYETAITNVARDGNDIYLSGMDRNLPDAWVKGTIDGDKVYFPSGQYLGPDYTIGYLSYFCGATFEYKPDPETGEDVPYATLADSAVFDYNEEEQSLLTVNGYVVNSTADVLYPLYAYDKVNLKLYNRNVDAVPETPYDLVYEENPDWDERKVWVQIPYVDVDGNMLDVNQLYYEILINGEPVVFDPEEYFDFTEATTLIPYKLNGYDVYAQGTDHTVYLYCEVEGTVGVRSVYINENGETLYSETVTTAVSSADNISVKKEIANEEWHDIYGRRIKRPASGISIHSVTYTDGSVSHRKVMVK